MMQIKRIGLQDYAQTWEAMREFTASRGQNTDDQLWIVEHPAVFTQGISGKSENLLRRGDIAVVQSDRGGQITYHGPGQLVIYCLIDIKRLGIGIKKMVALMELAIMDLLKSYAIKSHLKKGAHGVYVNDAKIAAIGLKVKNGTTYHGLSLNVKMDLSPFKQINPCGYQGLLVTQLADLTDNVQLKTIGDELSLLLNKYVTRN
ncbi:MAG: lipoyl(octanoyl) transferase LipB [Candidatus Thioglobus sp.]|nr:MAG: lipoyl(octanoyl) transferase LipB [Candidatus Thioglobus sp.]KAA0448936.1 MAG: lipoyl(octanoyl) transferase LipB [Candidatus Thioglobus sp.]